MRILLCELRRNKIALIIWSAAISFMLGVSIIIYPEMTSQMGDFSAMFSEMGAFSDAFGMDSINFGEFTGYFAIECGNVLGLGGALFAAIAGATALAGEEKEHTAEFLLTHPLSRTRIVTEKLLSVTLRILILNASAIAVSCVCILAIDADADALTLALIFLAHLLLQLQIMGVCFCISAFLHRAELGAGLGFVFATYFLNILSNLTEDLEALKFITPFSYTDGGYIIPEKSLDVKYLSVGLIITAIGIIAAYLKYTKKDVL